MDDIVWFVRMIGCLGINAVVLSHWRQGMSPVVRTMYREIRGFTPVFAISQWVATFLYCDETIEMVAADMCLCGGMLFWLIVVRHDDDDDDRWKRRRKRLGGVIRILASGRLATE